MTTTDPFDLERFVNAQTPVFSEILVELQAGRNAATEMWFVFPQLRRLGRSSDGIGSLGAAQTSLACLSPVDQRIKRRRSKGA